MKLNPKIAEALEMDLPPEKEESQRSLITVDPHEITLVENEDLPDMTDAETRLLEAEKQLEVVINAGLGTYRDLDETRPSVEPKFLSRHIETSGLILGHALDAIKHKTDLQIRKMDMRMKQKGFGGKKDKGAAPTSQTNFFVGSREDLLDMISSKLEESPDTPEE